MSYYEFVEDDFKVVDGYRCYRIRAIETFNNTYKEVKKGELGGYVYNTGLFRNSWVFGNVVVIDSDLYYNSYIIGDYTYQRLVLTNSSINGAGNYLNTCQQNYLTDVEVIGHNFIKGSRHSVIWGVDKNTKKITISVGCQLYSLDDWKKNYKRIADRKGYYNLMVKEYLTYLKRIEESLKPNNEKILEKISSNISSMKLQVTEPLKVETVSLVNSLQVSPKKSEGPARDKFGRFTKKNP